MNLRVIAKYGRNLTYAPTYVFPILGVLVNQLCERPVCRSASHNEGQSMEKRMWSKESRRIDRCQMCGPIELTAKHTPTRDPFFISVYDKEYSWKRIDLIVNVLFVLLL